MFQVKPRRGLGHTIRDAHCAFDRHISQLPNRIAAHCRPASMPRLNVAIYPLFHAQIFLESFC